MTPKFQYSLYPEDQVPGEKRAVAEIALRRAAKVLGIPLPGLKWFRSTSGREPVKVETPYPLWGFTQSGASPVDYNVYVTGWLSSREIFKTTSHEVFHLFREGSKKSAAEEADAEEFAEAATRKYFDQVNQFIQVR